MVSMYSRFLCSDRAQVGQPVRAAGSAPDGPVSAQGSNGDGGVGANVGRPMRRNIVVAVVIAC